MAGEASRCSHRRHSLVLFMQAARWADDIRIRDNAPPWAVALHQLAIQTRGQPTSVQIRQPEPVNILTAMAENESAMKNESDPERKAIALRGSSIWLASYTSPYTRRSYSPLTIPRATGVGRLSVRRHKEPFASLRAPPRSSQPKQHWDFHQPERRYKIDNSPGWRYSSDQKQVV